MSTYTDAEVKDWAERLFEIWVDGGYKADFDARSVIKNDGTPGCDLSLFVQVALSEDLICEHQGDDYNAFAKAAKEQGGILGACQHLASVMILEKATALFEQMKSEATEAKETLSGRKNVKLAKFAEGSGLGYLPHEKERSESVNGREANVLVYSNPDGIGHDVELWCIPVAWGRIIQIALDLR